MRKLMIALVLACVPFTAATAQEGEKATRVPAASVREVARIQSQQRTKSARPAWQAAQRSPRANAPRKQKNAGTTPD